MAQYEVKYDLRVVGRQQTLGAVARGGHPRHPRHPRHPGILGRRANEDIRVDRLLNNSIRTHWVSHIIIS